MTIKELYEKAKAVGKENYDIAMELEWDGEEETQLYYEYANDDVNFDDERKTAII